MLKRSLKRCVDWSQIDKDEYLTAMRESISDSTHQDFGKTCTHHQDGRPRNVYERC
jgi:cell filamentation protein